MKQGRFWDRCIAGEEETFATFGLAVGNSLGCSRVSRTWWCLVVGWLLSLDNGRSGHLEVKSKFQLTFRNASPLLVVSDPQQLIADPRSSLPPTLWL